MPTAGWRTIGMAGRPGQGLRDSERTRLVGGPARLGCHLRGRCKGRDHAAGGMEVMQAPGASLDETQLHGSGAHESGHPARLNSRSILKRHSRLKLPKSSSGSVPCQSKAPTRALSIREKAAKNFCPTHPPQQNTAMPFSSQFFLSLRLGRLVTVACLCSPERVRTGLARPYPRDG